MTAFSILIVLFGFISLTFGTPFYLQSLLTTTVPTAPSHISDFRKQPRSDSRADKPDQFPNFDFTIETTTVRRRKTAAEHYTTIFGRIIGNHRHNLGKLLKNVEMHHERRQQRLQQSTIKEFQNESILNSKTIKNNSDDFQSGLTVENNDYNEDIDDSVILTENSTTQNSHHPIFNNKYVSILLGKIGYTNETAGDLHRNITNKFISSSTTAAQKYLLNPLIFVWNSARNGFQLKGRKRIGGMLPETKNNNNNTSEDEILNDNNELSTDEVEILNIIPVAGESTLMDMANVTDATNITDIAKLSVPNENDNIETIENNNMPIVINIEPVNRIDDDEPDIDNNSYENSGFIGAAENVGIFILELVGTVAALSWGAFSQITAG